MARKQMVTREIKSICYTVKVVTSNDEISTGELELPASLDAKKVRIELEKVCAEAGLDFVKIVSTKECVRMYGIDVADFMKYAVELDPETRSPLKKTD